MKKALITGGAGFIGLHLARELLDHGYSVELVDNFSRAVRDPELEEVSRRAKLTQADLLVPGGWGALRDDFDVIFHLAAIIGVSNVSSRPYAVIRENAELLFHAIDFARRQKSLGRFVFASTSEVYAGALENFELPIPTPESAPLALTNLDSPRTSYMLSKIYGEAACKYSGLPFTIVRPHNFFGPRMGMSHVAPELLQKAYFAKPGDAFDVASPSHRRSFCYISDAVRMLRLAAEKDSCRGRTLNIGSQKNEISIREFAELVLAVTAKKLSIREKDETPGSPKRRCPEMTLARELLGYEAQVDVKKGLELTFDWYRKNVFDGGGPSAR